MARRFGSGHKGAYVVATALACLVVVLAFVLVGWRMSFRVASDAIEAGEARQERAPEFSFVTRMPSASELSQREGVTADDERDATSPGADDDDAPRSSARPASDDDGELHDGWDPGCGYSYEVETYEAVGVEHLDAYDADVAVVISAEWPVFSGAGPHTDELNEVVREAALEFAQTYYLEPDAEAVRMVRQVAAYAPEFIPGDADALLASEVTFAVTYNTADFVSVSFSDDCSIGSFAGNLIDLRCVNMNLATGERYELDDALTVTEGVAEAFVDALAANAGDDLDRDGVVSEDENLSLGVIGREEWLRALLGEGDYAHRVAPTLFVDEHGRVNLGVTYWLSSDRGVVRGWWDATLGDDALEGARRDSSLWELVG